MASDPIQTICDLRQPENWYPKARAINRKVIYHVGPPNSGKTWQALQKFYNASSGIYCAPLRLLANEVFTSANASGTRCDLLTGEEVKYADKKNEIPAKHVSCTVHMAEINEIYEVAVIDEIQMISDLQQGAVWTRAFFGLQAREVHVCGEEAGMEIIRTLTTMARDSFEMVRYHRLTPEVRLQPTGLGSLDKVQPGDCIVCFRRKDIHYVVKGLKKAGHCSPAVIYGAMPPTAKRKQAEAFNQQISKKVLVATDAIGMGLNLSIKRIIFWSLQKTTLLENGTRTNRTLTASHAQHIAGRAGRYNSIYQLGEVTTYRTADLSTLGVLLYSQVPNITRAGLRPNIDRLERLCKYYPGSDFSVLTQQFQRNATFDRTLYFLCNEGDLIESSNLLLGINLPVDAQYIFCSAPVPGNEKMREWLRSFANMYLQKEKVTASWLKSRFSWPLAQPRSIQDLDSLETKSDVLTLYGWLGNKLSDTFPDVEEVNEMQEQVGSFINNGVDQLSNILEPDLSALFSRFGI